MSSLKNTNTNINANVKNANVKNANVKNVNANVNVNVIDLVDNFFKNITTNKLYEPKIKDGIKKCLIILLGILLFFSITTSMFAIQYYNSMTSTSTSTNEQIFKSQISPTSKKSIEFKNKVQNIYYIANINIFSSIISVILCGALLYINYVKKYLKSMLIPIYIFLFIVIGLNIYINIQYNMFLNDCAINNKKFLYLYNYNVASSIFSIPLFILIFILYYFYVFIENN